MLTALHRFALVLLVVGALTPVRGQTPPPVPREPAELARAVQQRYDGIRDFTAAFTHAYEGGVLRKTIVERGTVQLRKPGQMRWVYTSPERKEFVSDGVRMYAYVPADRQVTISALPADDRAPTPLLFLAGNGQLPRDFDAAVEPEPARIPAGTVGIRLTPRRPEADFEWMTLVVDAMSLQIRGLVTVDAQGGRSAFTFERVRENTGIPARTFTFAIPRGVDVITNETSDR